MIVDRNKKGPTNIEIDLSGPEGNAIVLWAYAKNLGNQIYGPEKTEEILKELRSLQYTDMILRFDEYFGTVVTLYREGGRPNGQSKKES